MSMSRPMWFFQTAFTLVLGLAIGWLGAGRPQQLVFAGGNDRYGDSITASGPILVQQDMQKIPSALDAVYHLDYKGARLLGAIPNVQQKAATTKIIDGFAERDLIADFRLNPSTGSSPHFQMTTASLGIQAQGLSVLCVIETVSKQLAVYRLSPQALGTSTQPKFELLQLTSLAKATTN